MRRSTLGGIDGLRGGSGGRKRGVRVRWYVFSCRCRYAHVLFGSNENPSPFHVRRRRDSKDEEDAEVSASESECPLQCAATWTLFPPAAHPPPSPLSPFALQEENLDNLVAVFHGVGCCLLTPDVFLLGEYFAN